MHVLAFYQYFSTNEVSGSTRPYEIGRRMLERGDSVTFIAANWIYATGRKEPQRGLFWTRSKVDALDVIRVNIPFGGSRNMVPRIIGFLWFIPFSFFAAFSVRSPDVIVASSTPLTIGIPAYLLSRIRRVPFVFELRDLWPDCPVEWGFVKSRFLIRAAYWLESFLYRKAAFIFTVTEGIRKEIIKKGIPAERIRTITTANDLTLFTSDGPEADLLTVANIPADAFVCIHVGSLGFSNALDFLLDGAERLLDEPSIHFLIMGHGAEKARLKSEVSRRNLHNVHLLNPVPKAALPPFLRRADLGLALVKPTRYTYIFLQNKFFDYLACGCPVILNFEGEAREYIEPANAGVYVPPDDVDALAAAIRSLAADRATARTMGACARQVAERHFSWDYKAADYRETLSSVITESSPVTHGSKV
ncbi:MAG: glycosyltransferase family 4 protein [Bryobacteraceae bacterium]